MAKDQPWAFLVPLSATHEVPIALTHQEHVVGRGALRTSRRLLSKQHMQISRSERRTPASIVDLSFNGTFVNGTRLRKHVKQPLEHGAVVTLLIPDSPELAFVFVVKGWLQPTAQPGAQPLAALLQKLLLSPTTDDSLVITDVNSHQPASRTPLLRGATGADGDESSSADDDAVAELLRSGRISLDSSDEEDAAVAATTRATAPQHLDPTASPLRTPLHRCSTDGSSKRSSGQNVDGGTGASSGRNGGSIAAELGTATTVNFSVELVRGARGLGIGLSASNRITQLAPGGAAELSNKLSVGDLIVAVDGVPVPPREPLSAYLPRDARTVRLGVCRQRHRHDDGDGDDSGDDSDSEGDLSNGDATASRPKPRQLVFGGASAAASGPTGVSTSFGDATINSGRRSTIKKIGKALGRVRQAHSDSSSSLS